MTSAHAGYGSEEVPLGGGAAVCEALCRAWGGRSDVEVVLLGPGPRAPDGVAYRRIEVLDRRPPCELGELAYARFSRAFERETTRALMELGRTVLCHDLSEGPDFAALARAGVPCVPIFHVDVVDFFTRLYLRRLLPSPRAARWARRLRPWRVVPDLLRLVFDKQEDAVRTCPRLVVPSEGMRRALLQCYPGLPAERVVVVEWGAPEEPPPEEEVARWRRQLAAEWDLEEGSPVLVMLSRISPEKGHDRVLEALREGERRGEIPPGLRLVICGEAAYMRGASFRRRLDRLTRRLKRVQVIFAGHLGGARKRAALELAALFLSASRHESYGLTTMEAMAAGLPVVAVRTPGAEATVDPSCGVLVDPGPRLPARLWEAMRPLLASPARRARLAAGARRRAAARRFSQAAEHLLEILRQVS